MTYVTSSIITLMATLTILGNLQASQARAGFSASSSSVTYGNASAATSSALTEKSQIAQTKAVVTDPVVALGNDVFALGKQFFDQDKKIKAFYCFKSAAELGNGDSRAYLGDMFRDGDGVSKDLKRALKYYRYAAKAGILRAYSDIGLLYMTGGDGLAANAEKARGAFLKGDAKGDLWSSYRLGTLYAYGHGVEQDGPRAAQYFEKVREHLLQSKELDALQKDLFGRMYYVYAYLIDNGIGFEKDEQLAQEYIRTAAQYGNVEALDFLKAAVQDGDGKTALFLATLYESGWTVEQDLERAFLFYTHAARAGIAEGFTGARKLVWSGDLKKYLTKKLGGQGAQERIMTLVRFLSCHANFYVGAECSICRKEFVLEDRPVCTIPCMHNFCPACLMGWLNSGHATCPICRETLVYKRLGS